MTQGSEDTPSATLRRTLGTFERIAYEFSTRRPYQFTVLARLAPRVSPSQLSQALAAVAQSHPLLRVTVVPAKSQQTDLPRFRSAEETIPVQVVTGGGRWESLAADSLLRRIDPKRGPMLHAVLALDDDVDSCTIALTMSHVVCDGIAGLAVLTDLLRALDGEALEPEDFPAAQESFAGFSSHSPAAGVAPAPAGTVDQPGDPRPPAPLDPQLTRVPSIENRLVEADLLRALRTTARAQGVTVHSALCAAAVTALSIDGSGIVNVGSAVNLRHVLGLPTDVAVRFLGAHSITDRDSAPDFWSIARHARRSITAATAPAAVDAALSAMAAIGPIGADEAEDALRTDTHADILISNLGVYTPPAPGEHRLVALHGVALAMGVLGEQVLTAVTVNDTLSLTLTAREPRAGLLDRIVSGLRRSVEY